jgi:streptomycin 6-kinase
MYGEKGRLWLASLPALIEKLADKWEISEIHLMTNLSYNYVVSGIRHATPVILKIGNPVAFDSAVVAREAAALISLAGPCVKIIAQDDHVGALLLERLLPGTMLKELFPERDTEAINVTSALIKEFECCQNLSPLFLAVGDILTVLDKDWPPLQHHVLKARSLRTSLLATTSNHVLLHGDLHHENILLHGSTWRVIDPKGFVGDPAYECGAYIRNPFPELLACPDMLTIIKRRIRMFADLLNVDEGRIAQWTYVQAVVAACWISEDHLDPCLWIKMCDALEHIVPS